MRSLFLFFLAAQPASGNTPLPVSWELTTTERSVSKTTQLGPASGTIVMPVAMWRCTYNQAVEAPPHHHSRTLTCTDGLGVVSLVQSCVDTSLDTNEGLLFLSYLGARWPASVGTAMSFKCVSGP